MEENSEKLKIRLEAIEKVYDDRFRRDMERLKTLEDIQREQTVLMTRQAEISGSIQKMIGDHEARLRTIEHRPARLIDRILTPLLSVLISAIVSAVIYYLQNV